MPVNGSINDSTGWIYDPQPYIVTLPKGIPPFPFPANNPLTVQGVKLGRELFYDPILSADSTLSCGSCHNNAFAFTDEGNQFSFGIHNLPGKRNSMPIFNLAYVPTEIGFFWDGRAASLESQALLPIEDTLEMNEYLPNILKKLARSDHYSQLFYEAFGEDEIIPDLIGDAIAQFTRSIVSGNTRYDRASANEIFLTDQEVQGFELFNDLNGGDCFHCHGVNAGLFTDYQFRNNGLDNAFVYTDFSDPGFGLITGNPADYGKFKTPTLRNIALTAPYMHDGRFATLEEVLDFYSEQVNDTPFTDPFMQFSSEEGVQLTDEEKQAIIAFLNTLTDTSLVNNQQYSNPSPS